MTSRESRDAVGTAPARSRSATDLDVYAQLASTPIEVDALLEAVRDLLQSDTAAVLLVDASGAMLEPISYVGLGRTMRTAMRVPIGHGFAGTVAATRAPVIISRVTDEQLVNRQLHRLGVQSLMGVPMIVNGQLIGVLHVGSLTVRAFTTEDTELLQLAADRVARAVHGRTLGDEHAAALVLQRSLLPTTPPAVPGVRIGARYIPAEGDLGGDWYDVFVLPGDRLGMVMGDVAGHGLNAAVIMGRLRSALRAYALEHDDPAEVLLRLDRKITHFEAEAMATVLYAVAEAPYDRFLISSAGHPAPLWVAPGEAARQLDVPPDPPVGVGVRAQRRSTAVELPRGASLCLFTDGLVERRPRAEDDDQLEAGLRRALVAMTPIEPEQCCTNVINEALADEPAEDDVAVLVVHRDA